MIPVMNLLELLYPTDLLSYDSVKQAVISKLEKVTSLKFHVDSG